MVIINADDLGYDSNINIAILDSFQRGLCSSTTLMANMSGFEEACHLVHERRLVEYTGIHLVMTEGAPLTEKIRRSSRFCGAHGMFNPRRKGATFHLSHSEQILLAAELRAQIDRCRKNGIRITHADSHAHAHEEWGIASIAMKVCKETRIPWVRLARNCGRWRTPYNRAYRHILNWRLQRAGLARTRYFGSAKDCAYLLEHKGASEDTNSIEIMIHPGYDERGILVDRYEGVDLDKLVGRFHVETSAESFSGHRLGDFSGQ